ncbi:MAG TPA: SulP family inorganic anion transporter [Methylocella sp.]|nr:SulP family inorganic anion transporter [Methylocella sp.]
MLEALTSVKRYLADGLPADLAVGLAIAAVALPSQMATAELAGFPPAMGLIAFAAAMTGVSAIGANRFVVACADSTIAPIFASGLAGFAVAGTPAYLALSAFFAVIVGGLLLGCGLFRMGWLADLISRPVTIGFLAAIACHIVISQLPPLLGIEASNGSLPREILAVIRRLPDANPYSLMLGLGVFAVAIVAEWISPRIPGALIGNAAAAAAVYQFDLVREGVGVLGPTALEFPRLQFPLIGIDDLVQTAPLAFVTTAIILVQTAATSRAFPPVKGESARINRDFAGMGAANVMAGLFGTFPVDASPPLSGLAAQTGGRSKLAGLTAATLVLGMAAFGTPLLATVPMAGLAGTLLFVATRIILLDEMNTILWRAPGEFVLILVTFTAILLLPVGSGVAIGIVLSLLHGIWSMARPRLLIFERVPGTSIWWPPEHGFRGETLEGVLVLGFQAPLSFLNAYPFQESARQALRQSGVRPELIVLEASSIIEIDFTAAQILIEFIMECQQSRIRFAIARLESVRAAQAFERFGITEAIGESHFFHSVDEAIKALGKNPKKTNEFPEKPV